MLSHCHIGDGDLGGYCYGGGGAYGCKWRGVLKIMADRLGVGEATSNSNYGCGEEAWIDVRLV